MPQGQKEPKHKKQKQYCNKFNEDFKKVFHIKKKIKKKQQDVLNKILQEVLQHRKNSFFIVYTFEGNVFRLNIFRAVLG